MSSAVSATRVASRIDVVAGIVAGAAVLSVLLLIPVLGSTFFVSAVALPALSLGLAAASLTFLSGQGGMVSLAQIALFGVAGLTCAKATAHWGWNPWLGGLFGVAVATVIGLVFGAAASGSSGIYFLMITLAFAQITYHFFAAVPNFGAHEGINGVRPPTLLGDPVLAPARMYYFALAVCVLAFVMLRYVAGSAFGLALAGVRDDPLRMTAMGFNPRLHRILGFTLAAPIAGAAGVIAAWSNTRMSAGSISLGITITMLAVAVIGGLSRLEGAWVGAFIYTIIDTYSRGWSDRFATYLGLVFLVIVLLSPGGVVGLLSSLWQRLTRPLRRAQPADPAPVLSDAGQGARPS